MILGKGSFKDIYEESGLAVKKLDLTSTGYISPFELIPGSCLDSELICPIERVEWKLNQIALYMPIADCDVKVYLKKLQDKHILSLVKSLTQGLKYLHDHNILHGDIKPSNILVFDKHYKYADFGSSCYYLGKKMSQTKYTRQYRAPEVWRNDYDLKADIWALGCTLFEIAYKRILFPVRDEEGIKRILRMGVKELKENNLINNLINCMIDPDPEKRPSASNLYNYLFENIDLQFNTVPEEMVSTTDLMQLADILDCELDEEGKFSMSKFIGLDYAHDSSLNLDRIVKWDKLICEKFMSIIFNLNEQ